MEETMINPTQIYSANGNHMHAETACMDKKRKFPAEQLGMPLRKRISLLSTYLESGSVRNVNHKELNIPLIGFESCRRLFSDNNSLSGGKDTTISISSQIKDDIWYFKASVLKNQLSTSSVNWASTCSTKSLHSFESRPMAKSRLCSDETESFNYIGEQRDLDHTNFGSHSSPYHDDYRSLEFISLVDYTFSDSRQDSMEQCTDNKDQDAIYSNGVIPSNYVHSAGRWLADSEQNAKKLTIDKDFEQYFSMLML